MKTYNLPFSKKKISSKIVTSLQAKSDSENDLQEIFSDFIEQKTKFAVQKIFSVSQVIDSQHVKSYCKGDSRKKLEQTNKEIELSSEGSEKKNEQHSLRGKVIIFHYQ